MEAKINKIFNKSRRKRLLQKSNNLQLKLLNTNRYIFFHICYTSFNTNSHIKKNSIIQINQSLPCDNVNLNAF